MNLPRRALILAFAIAPSTPVTGLVEFGEGYLMVGAGGGIFNFSNSAFAGSLGDKPPASAVVAVAALP